MFPDHVIKPSRKGFDLGTWNELDNLSSRCDSYYCRENRYFGPFLLDHVLVLISVLEMGGEWL